MRRLVRWADIRVAGDTPGRSVEGVTYATTYRSKIEFPEKGGKQGGRQEEGIVKRWKGEGGGMGTVIDFILDITIF